VTAAGTLSVLDVALALGLPAFPVGADKRPACPRGFLAAAAEPAAIRDLWRHYPGPLVGVPTGAVSGFDALDIDAPRHPEAAGWLAARRDRLPATWTHRTRSGGLHLLFAHRPGLRNWAGHPVLGVDGRCDGGYICWWPGAGLPIECDAEPAPWPEWLLAEIASRPTTRTERSPTVAATNYRAASRYATAALRHAAERMARAPIGTRNTALNAEAFGLAGLVAAGSLDGQAVADALAAAATTAGLPAAEILATLGSAFAARGLL
jgi:hypothetical protein